MKQGKFKTYLITNIPNTDWSKFKKWSALNGFNNLNDAISILIHLAGNNKLDEYRDDSATTT